ncbi:MAG: sensor histidine kinase [Gammaproteobacteria bacterium]|nr:sensor histidine kinase [Gammaproteobacteria bacterium]
MNSIRRHLLRWLILPITLLLAVGAIGDYRIALQAASRAYDDELLNTALAVFGQLTKNSNQIGINFPPVAERVLMLDQYDQTFFAVTGPRDELIAGVPDLPASSAPPAWQGHLHYDRIFRGKPVRVAALYLPYQGSRIVIQAAQTIVKRQRLAREILVGMLLPEILVAFATLGLVWFGVGKGLQPLLAMRDHLSARSDRDLQPIPNATAPTELQPVLNALNGFLNRLRGTLDAQTGFVSNAAHQLRTPLAVLLSQVELGLRQKEPAAWKETLEKVYAVTKRTTRIANQLLSLARAEPAVWRDHPLQLVDLRALVQAAASDWVNRSVASGQDLGLELHSACTMGDPVLLHELLSNLVDNALKYAAPNGRITVRTLVHEQRPTLVVEDDGPGIAPHERAHVFERFYRIEGTRGEGCGLGLAIVREIADTHGAIVTLREQPDTRGTYISVSFSPAPPDSVTAPT